MLTMYLVLVIGVVGAGRWGKKDLSKIALVLTIIAIALDYATGWNNSSDLSLGNWNVLAGDETWRVLKIGGVERAFLLTLSVVAIVILTFGTWYMSHEPFVKYFELIIASFIGSMMLFVVSQDLITVVTFWEGIGITSFLLIGFYSTRLEANKAAIKAVIMNKIGDIGLMVVMASLASCGNLKISGIEEISGILGFIILAMAAKSAQFGLHGW